MILVLGPTSGGKSSLLQKLSCKHSTSSFDLTKIASTVPTIGTSIIHVKKGKSEIIFKEVGGSMADIALDNVTEVSGVLFVIDSADTANYSSVVHHLISMVKALETKLSSCNGRITIILNKADSLNTLNTDDVVDLLMIEDIIHELEGKVRVSWMVTSCVTGLGVEQLYTALFES
ncbi:ADP-ribosylation factor-like protein 16 [Halotydeus destructor]|nr:ADP-ribosylation factor-like protein 16 [Halotydeus destructor]